MGVLTAVAAVAAVAMGGTPEVMGGAVVMGGADRAVGMKWALVLGAVPATAELELGPLSRIRFVDFGIVCCRVDP